MKIEVSIEVKNTSNTTCGPFARSSIQVVFDIERRCYQYRY